MKLKRRVLNLESQPAKHTDEVPAARKETALEFVRRWRANRQAEIDADPEAWERGAEAREQSRLQLLRDLGFPEGSKPTPRELLQRFIERRNK